MYRHALCVYPYREDVKRMQYVPPLGLECVAAVLEPYCHEIEVVDLRHETAQTVDFLRPDTDLVCFSVNWEIDVDFIRDQIRSVPDHTLTIVGGRHATEDPEQWLRDCPNVDILVRGDGEEAAQDIARQLPLESIQGISRRQDGTIVHNPNRQLGPVRDDMHPNRRLRRQVYSLTVEDIDTGLTVDTVCTSRGCPFNCKFCSFNRNPWGGRRAWSARSPESVVRELAEIDADIVMLVDDNPTHDMDRIGDICDLILERGIKKHYLANARLEVARRMDVVRKMERAGFFALLLGIESAHDKTLRSMNKGFTTKQIEEYCGALRHSTIVLHGYFILGNIGETEQEMLDIADFAARVGLDTLGLSALRSLPYDGLGELVAETPGYYIRPDGLVCSDAVPREKLREIRHRIIRQFYTPRHTLEVAAKVLRSGIFSPPRLVRLLPAAARIAVAKHRRRRLHQRKKQAAAPA